MMFFVSSRRLHTRCALVTGVQTCALPISDPATCHITLPGNSKPISLQIRDISTGGIALVDNQQQLGTSTGAVYPVCQLELPGTGTLSVKLQVMRFINEAQSFDQESRHEIGRAHV